MSQDQTPFDAWVEAARPRAQLWRTAVGMVVILAVWFVWTIALLFVAVATGLVEPQTFNALFGDSALEVTHLQSAILFMVVLATLGGLALGVWLALRLVHKRRLSSVYSHDAQVSRREFAFGCAIAGVYLAVSLALSAITGNAPRRSDVEFGAWLLALGPLCLVIVLQAASEELVFRGYLPQQLAARFRSPLVWALMPTLIFGFLHAGNVAGDVGYMAFYVVFATMLGLVMIATVWRTGSIATAMGIHIVNNIVALTIAGPAGDASLSLFVWSASDLQRTGPGDFGLLCLLLVFVLSPWAPFPKSQPFGRRKDTRAAP